MKGIYLTLSKTENEMLIYDISKLDASIQEIILGNPKYVKLFSEFPKKLLTIGKDPKTVKGEKYGAKTGILYLSPSKKSGQQVCPMAKIANCEGPCLDEAGQGIFENVQIGRLRKTLFLQQYQEEFISLLKKEVINFGKLCNKQGFIPAIRPNGTSDIRFENLIWDFMVQTNKDYGVRWYDYTKIANRLIPDNKVYDLTFSYSGVEKYQKYVDTAKSLGMRLAVVFRTQDMIPKSFLGMDVVDGDDSDLRFLEPQGVVSALYAKGKAKKDYSGFVVDC